MTTPTKRWACSYIDWFDHELTTRIVSAYDWLSAFKAAFPERECNITNGEDRAPESLEEAKENAFNSDSMVEVKEIPEVPCTHA